MAEKIGYWKWLYKKHIDDLKFIATVFLIIGSVILALLFCYGLYLLSDFLTNFSYDSLELHIQILLVVISNLFLSLIVVYIFIKSYRKYRIENPEGIV